MPGQVYRASLKESIEDINKRLKNTDDERMKELITSGIERISGQKEAFDGKEPGFSDYRAEIMSRIRRIESDMNSTEEDFSEDGPDFDVEQYKIDNAKMLFLWKVRLKVLVELKE